MERKVLLFGLLQSLSLFASARWDCNGTSMDSFIDSDFANIAEHAETLEYSPANVSLDADGEQGILLPFGALKTDWKRLQLLHDALPPNSVLKPKFKHLFRLLFIAYDQMIRFAASRESTKREDTINSETTLSIPIKADGNIEEVDKKRPITEHETILNSTDPNQQIAATLKAFSSTNSSVSSKYDKDSVDAKLVTTENSRQRTIVRDNEDKKTVKSDTPETNATIRSPMITATSKPILEMSNTDKNLDDLSVSEAPDAITAKPQVFSTSGKDTPVCNEKKKSQSTTETSINSITANYSSITTSLSENETNLTKHKKLEENVSTISLDVNATPSNEIIVKQEIGHSSSPSSTVAVAVGINIKWEKAKANDTLSYQPSNKTVSIAETTANQNFSATTASNFVSSKSESLNSTSREKLTISTIAKKSSSPTTSAVTASDSETTRGSFSTSTEREEHLSSTTIKKNLLPMPVTTAMPVVVTLEKSKTSSSIRNFTTDGIKIEKSLPSESPYQSTRKANSSSERAAAPIGGYSSTLSATKVYTVASVQLTTQSAANAPIAGVRDNEKKKLTSLDYGVKFATSEKPTEKKYEVLNNTDGLFFTSGNSTVSSNTRFYVDERSTTTNSTNKINFSSAGERMNKTDTSNYGTVTEKINHRGPGNTGTNSTAGLIPIFSSATISTSTRNYADESSTTVITAKETNSLREKPPMNKTDTSKDTSVTEKINFRVPNDTRSVTDENKNTSKTTGKPIYMKNPLHAGSPSGNHISRDFKHGAETAETSNKKGDSEEIILYETGGGAKTGNVWRPHIVREQPIGNNIRRFDKYPPSGRYGYQWLPSSATTKPDVNGGSGRSAKWPFLDRTNLLRSRKRGSANADIEKQFRSFYREGKIDPSTKSRIDENHNSNIMIQCKNV